MKKLNKSQFPNLLAIDELINDWSPVILSLYDVNKRWAKGQHLIGTIRNKPHETVSIYVTRNADMINSFYQIKFNNNCIIFHIIDDKNAHLYYYHYPDKTALITKYSDSFVINGRRIMNATVPSSFTKFSLVTSMCQQQMTPEKQKAGALARIAKEAGYEKIILEFQHKNGEMPKSEIKSLVEAYKIIAPHFGKTIQNFRYKLKNDIVTVDCGSYVITARKMVIF